MLFVSAVSGCCCCCSDDDRLYGFLRLNTGDELSKRVKFVFLTWVGVNVGALNRAKMSTDKTVVKAVIKVSSFSSFIHSIQSNATSSGGSVVSSMH